MRTFPRRVLSLVALVAVLALVLAAQRSTVPQSPAASDPLLRLVPNLASLTRVTEQPVRMSIQALISCVGGPPRDHSTLVASPDAVIQVYVTPSAVAAMLDAKPTFPVGTVILKQKFPTPAAKAAELYTGMLKREQGFNPDCGDWEFFTLNGAGTVVTARGKIESCMDCHKSYPQSDFVTRDYPIRHLAPKVL